MAVTYNSWAAFWSPIILWKFHKEWSSDEIFSENHTLHQPNPDLKAQNYYITYNYGHIIITYNMTYHHIISFRCKMLFNIHYTRRRLTAFRILCAAILQFLFGCKCASTARPAFVLLINILTFTLSITTVKLVMNTTYKTIQLNVDNDIDEQGAPGGHWIQDGVHRGQRSRLLEVKRHWLGCRLMLLMEGLMAGSTESEVTVKPELRSTARPSFSWKTNTWPLFTHVLHALYVQGKQSALLLSGSQTYPPTFKKAPENMGFQTVNRPKLSTFPNSTLWLQYQCGKAPSRFPSIKCYT